MSEDVSDIRATAVETVLQPFDFESSVDFVLGENCRKQEVAIRALEDSAYVMRRGRRELQDPKRLALAIKLRSAYMADLAAFGNRVREFKRVIAYVRELAAGLNIIVDARSPELRESISEFISKLNNKYAAPSDYQSGQTRQED